MVLTTPFWVIFQGISTSASHRQSF